MEPLRGGAFGRMAQELVDQLKAVRPDDSTARWAFRWVGSYPNILTTLSGMNRMDHLEENVQTFSPLEICTEAEWCTYDSLHGLRILHALSLQCRYPW